jgi:flagellin-like protein
MFILLMSIDLTNENGVSPVVGVVLMVAITVALSAVVGLVVFDIGGNQGQPVQAGVTVNETTDGVEVRVNSFQTASEIQVNKNKSTVSTLTSVGSSTVIPVKEGDTISVIGRNEQGDETVLRDHTASQTAAAVSGTVSYNPPAEGVTVKALDESSNVVAKNTTGEDGVFVLDATGDSYTVNGYDVNASVSDGTDIELDSSDVANGGDTVPKLLMDTDGSGNYKVDSASDLYAIDKEPTGNYKLTSDIDLSHTTDWNNGTGWDPISNTYASAFTGTLSGNDKTISGLTITKNSRTKPVGLFSIVDGSATIKNVTVQNVEIKSNSGVFQPVGAIAGITNYNATIDNVTVSGSVTKENDGAVGGIVGSSEGLITDSKSTVDVTGVTGVGGISGDVVYTEISNSVYNGNIEAVGRTGGITGEISNGAVVKTSYSKGTITAVSGSFGEGKVGGAVGSVNDGTLKDSYSKMDIQVNGSHSFVGGLAGVNSSNGTTSDSYATGNITGFTDNASGLTERNSNSLQDAYWDSESGFATSDTGTGLTTSEMQGSSASSNMSGLDFTSTWETVDGDYPQLQNNPE